MAIHSPAKSSSSSSNSNSNSNSTTTTQTPPITPRFKSDPYNPTTFVQADTTSFKQVVQMLTGSNKTIQQIQSKMSIPPVKTGQQKKQGFKLHERRNTLKNGLLINPSAHYIGSSPRTHELLSPSILDFPALALSPATPRGTPEPQLLPLFPVKPPSSLV